MKKLLTIFTISILTAAVTAQNANFLPQVNNSNSNKSVSKVSDRFSYVGQIENGPATGMVIDLYGTVWVTVKTEQGGKIYKKTVNQNSFTEVLTTKYHPSQIVIAGGNIWVGTGDGVYRGELFVKPRDEDKFSKCEDIGGSITTLTMSQNNSVWVAAKIADFDGEVLSVLYNKKEDEKNFTPIDKVTGTVMALATWRDHLWVSVPRDKNSPDGIGTIYRKFVDDKRLIDIGNSMHVITSMVIDERLTIWGGTKNHGIYTARYREIWFREVKSGRGVSSILVTAKNYNVWAGAILWPDKGMIYQKAYDRDEFTEVQHFDKPVCALEVDTSQTVWVATSLGGKTSIYKQN